MNITKLAIRGFRSFGPSKLTIPLNQKLSGFIGLNSAGKTTALESLRKLFGSSLADKEICTQDFHITKDEIPDQITEKELSIEVHIDFSEDEKTSVPHFFRDMIVDDENGSPYVRIRLEANWKKSLIIPDGEIDSKTYFITASENQQEEDHKLIFPNHFRSLIQIIYVPAIRRPAEQLRYASGSILHRVLKKIKWNEQFKIDFDFKVEEINDAFKRLPEFNIVQSSISCFWQQFHKDERYKDSTLGFSGSDFDSILRKLEITFSPTGTHRKFLIDELGEGYRSLFYLTLVCSLLDIEEQLAEQDDKENIGINRPLLTILAIEEPENHIAPQLLGRVIKILKNIAIKENCQVLLSSHTPAIIKRIEPESILHFRITDKYETEVNSILLPEKSDEAYKYVKEAVHNYPELYFSKLAIIGEGDSEEVLFNRLMDVRKVNFDDNIITFAPLGHRFVNHIWKLLEQLHIPYVTLLDLDTEREGGGWGRIKYALKQLIAIGKEKKEVLALSDNTIMSDESLDNMHKRELKDSNALLLWVKRLEHFGVYFSSPLDLDFLMLTHYKNFYQAIIPKNGGPQVPNKKTKPAEFEKKLTASISATLKSEAATAETYSDEDKENMIWYNYHFLGRGKPTTHILALSSMTDEEISDSLPPVLDEVFDQISSILNLKEANATD